MSAEAAGNYPADTIARLLNITVRRLYQLVQEGVVPAPVNGLFSLVGCVRGYIGMLQDRSGREVETYQRERTRIAKANADKKELDLQRVRGELISRQSVELHWAGMLAALRTRLLGLPTKLAPVLPVKPQQRSGVQQTIRREVHELLEDLAGGALEHAVREHLAATGGATPGPAAGSDAQPVGGHAAKAKRRSRR